MTLNAIIFDCDGVLIDSNNMKTDAFKRTLETYPDEMVQEFLGFQMKNFGISRYRLFEIFISDFLKKEDSGEMKQAFLQRFGQLCEELYVEMPLTPDCEAFLQEAKAMCPLFVASGSDESELRNVFDKRGLSHYFRAVYGSPTSKADNIAKAIDEIGTNENVLMIGDARSDFESARKNGIDFIFMSQFSNVRDEMLELSKVEGFRVIENLGFLRKG